MSMELNPNAEGVYPEVKHTVDWQTQKKEWWVTDGIFTTEKIEGDSCPVAIIEQWNTAHPAPPPIDPEPEPGPEPTQGS